MQKFTSSRIFYAIVLGLAVVGASFLISRPDNPAPVKKTGQNLSAAQTEDISISDLLYKDSDYDSVSDWEEALWGTDTGNPDTYGRGLGDRTEINEKKAMMALGGEATTTEGSDSQTAIFGRQLYTTLAALSQSGNLNDSSIKNLASQISQNLKAQAMTNTYVKSDLKIIPTTSATLETYRKQILVLISQHQNDPLGSEMSAMAEAISTGNREKLNSVKKYADLYRKAAEDFMAIPVPDALADTELAIGNAYDGIATSLLRIETILDDPLAGMVELNRYRESTDLLSLSLMRLSRYYMLRGTIN